MKAIKKGFCKFNEGFDHDNEFYEFYCTYELRFGEIHRIYTIVGLDGWDSVYYDGWIAFVKEIDEIEYNALKYNL